MAKHDRKGRSKHAGEHWTKMLRTTMETPAWGALSTSAQALYPWLKLEWRGPDANNNGAIALSVRQAANRLGVALNTAALAFHDLQAKGFIVQTSGAHLGTSGEAKCPTYELTEIKLPGSDQPDGRKLYRQWQEGHDFPVRKASTNNPNGRNGRKKPCLKNEDGAVSKTKTKHPVPVSKTKTGRLKNDDEMADFDANSVSISKTSLSYHTDSDEAQASGHSKASEAKRVGDVISLDKLRNSIRPAKADSR